MSSKLDEITQQLEKNNNILLYQDDLYNIYKHTKENYRTVYISTPKKGKLAYEQILKKTDKKADIKNKTISKLMEEIKENTTKEKICICMDNFEQLTKRELENYRELIQQENIQFIANINEDKNFVDNKLLDNFIIMNEEYLSNRSQSINIKYVILLLLSFLIFILFLRIQLSIIRYIISGLWFTLLMYRSFYYISK
ncbi:MAG: hypothetical protein BZ138_04585 [Methanosphaera sp. rholeuAM270]|nr:MAG: hypothetical protein BZ138_04585 [Methanosphaera sp. rholeuAM270]